jgi:hypothetical protein
VGRLDEHFHCDLLVDPVGRFQRSKRHGRILGGRLSAWAGGSSAGARRPRAP